MNDIETRAPAMNAVAAPDARLEKVAGGFAFTEGPIWHPEERALIFSDMPGDHMRRWTTAGGVETFRQPSNMANGNAFDRDGRILTCEHATSRVVRLEKDGALTVLASHWDGKELNSPNDIICGPDGAIWFTDPTFGRMEYYGLPRDQALDFQGVYRIGPDGTLALAAADFGQPNGLCLSDDGRTLFVNDTQHAHIRRFDVGADGALSGGAVWAAPEGEGPGAPDGMKLDAGGRLFCTGPGGVHVFAPDGAALGVIRAPEVVANFTWGDDDLKTLYLTASTSLYRIRLEAPGRDLFRI